MKCVGAGRERAARLVLAPLVMVMASESASAQGLITMVKNFGELGNNLIATMIILAGVGGVGSFIYAWKLLMKKSGDRGDDVEYGKIGLAVVAGVIGLCIAAVAAMSIETAGASASDIGKGIRINAN